jgi:4-diphosphocytidyl-2-C-methyl-D-erythritol kinase
MSAVRVFSPAKINLSLAVTGRRSDGFHELVSLVAPLDWGDTLTAELAPTALPGAPRYTLTCEGGDPALTLGEDNLILRAAAAHARATGWIASVRFQLEKRIPLGAGLGGGSSNAVAALRALQQLAGPAHVLPADCLHVLAAELGSDCPLFLHSGPVVMRGRGEQLAPLVPAAAAALRGRRVLLAKPAFGVATPWAFSALAARAAAPTPPGGPAYADPTATEHALAAWLAAAARGLPPSLETLPTNTLQPPVFAKFLALPLLLRWWRERHGVHGRMSGSGSTCFAWLEDHHSVEPLVATVRAAWGEAACVQLARLL